MAKNPGLAFDEKYFQNVNVNASCIEKLTNEIIETVDGCDFFDVQEKRGNGGKIDWLIQAIELIDLTTLAGDDSRSNVARLCYSAINPIPSKIVKQAGTELSIAHTKCAAVCVYPACVGYVKESLDLVEKEKRPDIAAVATGFPTGLFGLESRLQEIRSSQGVGSASLLYPFCNTVFIRTLVNICFAMKSSRAKPII